MAEGTFIVGVMGGGTADEDVLENAYRLGRLIAVNGWILLNGGRNAGVMAASAKGAFEAGGMTVGILPDADDRQASGYIRIPVLTGMGNARNVINVLSSHVIVACPGGAGTLSEIALAIKCARPVIFMGFPVRPLFASRAPTAAMHTVETPEEAVAVIRDLAEERFT
ncbi:MAG: TIGR00725 family protein [Desulfobacterales bacterium]